MAGFADYEAHDALGLADLVRRRKVTPTELLDAAIARVEARNPTINAVVLPLYDYARKAIADGLPDGPFRGVPYLLKDLTASLAGVRTMRGSRFFADTPPAAADSEHVARLKRAGPGRLRADQHVRARALAHLRAPALRRHQEPVGPDPHLGRLERRRRRGDRRPHRPDGARERRLRVDPRAGGLLRAGRPQADARPEHDGALHRRGAGRALHRARRDPDGPRLRGAPRRDRGPGAGRPVRRARRPPGRSSSEVGAPAGRLRIAWTLRAPNGAPVDPACQALVREIAALCTDLGHDVSEADPEIDRDAVVPTFLTLAAANSAVNVRTHPTAGRPPRRGEVENVTFDTAARGRADLGARLRPGHPGRPPARPPDGRLPPEATTSSSPRGWRRRARSSWAGST